MLRHQKLTDNTNIRPTIDYFPLSRKGFLRYGIWRGNKENVAGTVLILQDYGSRIETITPLAETLCSRGLHVASFDWSPYPHPRPHSDTELPDPLADFRQILRNLHEIFSHHFLPHLPVPFYGIGIGVGALLGLVGHKILQSQLRRMILLSPPFAPHGHRPGGVFHHYSRLMSDLGLGGWRTNQAVGEHPALDDPIILTQLSRAGCAVSAFPTLNGYQNLLDSAQLARSLAWSGALSIPMLFIVSSTDTLSNPALTREFCQNLRNAITFTLRHADRFPYQADSAHHRQFWAIFDAFIPGTGAPLANRSLENGLIL